MSRHTIYYTSPFCYPVLSIFSLIHTNYEILAIPYIGRLKNTKLKYTDDTSGCIINDNVVYINILWLSIIENSYYSYQKCIKIDDFEYEDIIIELNPKGFISILNCDKFNSVIKLHENSVELESESELLNQYIIKEYRNYFIKNRDLNFLRKEYISILESSGYNICDIKANIDNYYKRFQQYKYRYIPIYDVWNKDSNCWQKNNQYYIESTTKELNDILFDGSFCKLLDNNLLFNNKGKPFMIKIKWNDSYNDYYAFYWINEHKITPIFERFYGAHPETKTDFIIRIDAENRKYELALFRQGLKEPYIIPEEAYQLIVFKNKFEDYRSENYNQERGAWIW